MHESKGTSAFGAMVLAAGFGTRLQPLSLQIPKPLIPVLGKPLLDLILEPIFSCGIKKIALNGHHLQEQIRDFVQHHPKSKNLTLFEEEVILGTGGALDNARAFLQDYEHFLIHNGDVLSNLDLKVLMRSHCQSGALVTLVLVPGGPEAKVLVTKKGRVVALADKIGSTTDSPTVRCTYSGIAAFSRRFLQFIPKGKSSLIDALDRAIQSRPEQVRGLVQEGLYWNDVGSFEKYFQAHRDLLDSKVALCPHQEPEFLAEQASDRQFLRLRSGKNTFVLMLTPPEDPEFTRFVKLATFLHELDLGPAKIVAHHTSQHAVIMEDLGDQTLFHLAEIGRSQSELAHWYERAVFLLVDLQTRGTQRARSYPIVWERRLNYEQLRWETNYFSTFFLHRFLEIPEKDISHLECEFDRLARDVARQPQVLIHRDYQSTNLLVHQDRIRMVDFQGARFGPAAYDLASLLLDPYNSIQQETISKMLDIYRRTLAHQSTIFLSADELEFLFMQAGMQRLMQALGAYGFLTLEKAKPFFTAFMRPGLRRLTRLLTQMNKSHPHSAMPCLEAVVNIALEKLAKKDL